MPIANLQLRKLYHSQYNKKHYVSRKVNQVHCEIGDIRFELIKKIKQEENTGFLMWYSNIRTVNKQFISEFNDFLQANKNNFKYRFKTWVRNMYYICVDIRDL